MESDLQEKKEIVVLLQTNESVSHQSILFHFLCMNRNVSYYTCLLNDCLTRLIT